MAELTGQIKNHPSRFRDRTDAPADGNVGAPPDWLGDVEKAAWYDFASAWPWVSESDHAALTLLCLVHGKIHDPTYEAKASLLATYRLLICDFGGTPASRSRVDWQPEDDKDDPFAQFN